MQLIDGKLISATVKQEIAQEVQRRLAQGRKRPHLAAIIVGEDSASQTYVASKVKSCAEVGFASTKIELPASTDEAALLAEVARLNADADIDGFIVQLPLPSHIDEQKIIEAIDPAKDVDGFHPINVGRMALSLDTFLPATPAGIVELLRRYQIPTAGKHCVVIGRSNIVGTPVSILLSRKASPGDCTVTLAHSRTQNLAELMRSADILIAALGKPHFVKADMVKQGATVIDVGIHRIPSDKTNSGFRLVGDVDFDAVKDCCEYITPVPGGVGLMTIVALLQNTLQAAANK